MKTTVSTMGLLSKSFLRYSGTTFQPSDLRIVLNDQAAGRAKRQRKFTVLALSFDVLGTLIRLKKKAGEAYLDHLRYLQQQHSRMATAACEADASIFTHGDGGISCSANERIVKACIAAAERVTKEDLDVIFKRSFKESYSDCVKNLNPCATPGGASAAETVAFWRHALCKMFSSLLEAHSNDQRSSGFTEAYLILKENLLQHDSFLHAVVLPLCKHFSTPEPFMLCNPEIPSLLNFIRPTESSDCVPRTAQHSSIISQELLKDVDEIYLCAVTNYDGRIKNVLKGNFDAVGLRGGSLIKYFHSVTTSHDCGCIKPAPGGIHLAMRRCMQRYPRFLKVHPDGKEISDDFNLHWLHVGDSPEDAFAADIAGVDFLEVDSLGVRKGPLLHAMQSVTRSLSVQERAALRGKPLVLN